MSVQLILNNILSPPILFFFLGMFATFVKSDLEIPNPLPKLFSLYLLMQIGFNGGYELHHNATSADQISHIIVNMSGCLIMSVIVPIYCFFILKIKFNVADAAAIAATFGSISAVTFISATAFLENLAISYGGYMVAGMALMETPAIILGVLLYNLYKDTDKRLIETSGRKRPEAREGAHSGINWGHLLQDAFFNGSVLLLIGSLIIGFATGDNGWHALEPFNNIFKGMLCFYLLDNGIIAAQRLKSLRGSVLFLVGFGILVPLFNAAVAILLAKYVMAMEQGDALLFVVLSASASYIAVPAAIRLAIPKSNPAFTVPVALGIVFPFNVIIGIPLYYSAITILWS